MWFESENIVPIDTYLSATKYKGPAVTNGFVTRFVCIF